MCRTVKYLYSPGGRTIKHRQSWTCRIVKLDIRWIRSIRGSLIGGRCAQNLKKIFFKIIQICLILGLILADFEAARPTLLSITKGCFEHGLHRLNGLAICRIQSIRGRFGFLFFQWLCGDDELNCKFFYAIQLFCVHLQFQP